MYRHATYGLLSLGKNTFVIIGYEVFLIMWRRVIGWLLPDVSRQRGGLVFKGRTVEVPKAELKSQSSQRTGLPYEEICRTCSSTGAVMATPLKPLHPARTPFTKRFLQLVLSTTTDGTLYLGAVSAHTARPTHLSAAYRAVILDAQRSKHSCDFQELLVSVINSINVCPSKDAAIVYKTTYCNLRLFQGYLFINLTNPCSPATLFSSQDTAYSQ
jgi:hypothetical protein